jgi:hypothetical protein
MAATRPGGDATAVHQAAHQAAHQAGYQAAAIGRDGIRDRLLAEMDPAVAQSFTDQQVRELERVLAAPAARPVPVDIRITVPFFRRGFFIAVLAGPERRSPARRRKDRAAHALWTFWNLCCFAVVSILSVPTAIGLLHILAEGL